MEEIQENDYVRTQNGLIRKIDAIMTGGIFNLGDFDCTYGYIKKHSKNIIDLIEVGDIVNNYKILNIVNLKNSDKKVFTICKSDFKDICRVWGNEDIKTILTHEQYENNFYRIGE